MSEITWETIDAIHSARKNYIQAENSQRIRQALKHQVRTYADEVWENGEKGILGRKISKVGKVT